MKYLLIGIDPGVSGGVAYQLPNGKVGVEDCPETLEGMYSLIYNITEVWADEEPHEVVARLEKVHGNPRFGVKNFTFGLNYGMWQAVLTSFDITWDVITPANWQGITLDYPGENTKERAWAFATRQFPKLKSKLGDKPPSRTSRQSNRADALGILYSLIEEYG